MITGLTAKLLLGVQLALSSGQAPQHATSVPECVQCKIIKRPLATLSLPANLGGLTDPYFVRLDSKQRYFVVSERSSALINVFSPSGQLIHRINAGVAAGFKRINTIAIAPGDSILAFDRSLGRLAIFSPTFEFIRVSNAPQDIVDALVVNNQLVVAGIVYSSRSIGWPLHTLSSAGNVTSSFGTGDGAFSPEMRLSTRLTLMPEPSGGFIASYLT